MSYVLSPNGKIISKKDNKEYNAGDVTKEVLESNKDFFESKMIGDTPFAAPSAVILPTGIAGLTSSALGKNYNEYGIIEKERPVIEEDTLFPNKSNADGKNNLLVNPSFGSSGPVSYYSQYNSHLNKSNDLVGSTFKNNIYAEELEMLAGIDFNTLGIAFNLKNIDFSYFFFAIDFILESIVYITTAWFFLSTKSTFPVTPIRDYFHNLLNLNTKKYNDVNSLIEGLELNHLIKYFIAGLEEFMLTDAKVPSLIEEDANSKIKRFANDGTITFFITHFKKILLYFSKVGRNRFFLLIRKIQKESYWHSEILYKAKEDTAENFVDKFFVEFSHYYFKFLFERINIGYITIQSDTFKYMTQLKTNNKNNQTNFVDLFRDKSSILHSRTADQSLNKQNLLLEAYDNKTKRFKNKEVAKVQKELEEGYMPFYFHDLRTNEILSFNAHLNSISDSFTPNYNETKGYGRIDSVRHYIDTTRSISLGFSLVAQSEQEFSHIWYQVEKLVAMVYPQWSQGIPANTGKFKGNKSFRFPFTQMPTASPMIRLKVGDIFKSNYSKQSIKGLHGNIRKNKLESVTELSDLHVFINNNNLNNFFIVEGTDNSSSLKSSNRRINELVKDDNELKLDASKKMSSKGMNSKPAVTFDLKNNIINEKISIENIALEDIADKEVRRNVKLRAYDDISNFILNKNVETSNLRSVIAPEIEDFIDKTYLYEIKHFIATLNVSTYYMFTSAMSSNLKVSQNKIKKVDSIKDSVTNSKSGRNNPYTAAFESAQGLGLAGFITSLGVEGMNESTWNVFESGANAPHSVKISIGFAPVHDIAPGLDHNGQIRAPVYNVGSKSHSYFGNRSINEKNEYED